MVGEINQGPYFFTTCREGRDRFAVSLARLCFFHSRLLILLPNPKCVDSLDGAKTFAAGCDNHGKAPRVFKAVHGSASKTRHGKKSDG